MNASAAMAACLLLFSLPAHAQSISYGQIGSGNVSQSGSVTAGDVAVWAGSGSIRDGGGSSGTVTSVGLTVPSWLMVSGSPVTNSGTLAVTGAAQAGNLFLASPNGTAGVIGPRAILGGDLPTPTSSTLGGVESLAPAAHYWLDSVSTAGVPHASQPTCADLSGAASSCSIDATNAANIVSGTLSAARLPTAMPGNVTFSGNNLYSGTSTWTGSLYIPIRVVTAAGSVTVSAATDYMIVIAKTTPAATILNYTCTPGFTFLVKDGAGNDMSNPITLTPSSGAIDGAATFVMNASSAGAPPYEARAVTCDPNSNSWVNLMVRPAIIALLALAASEPAVAATPFLWEQGTLNSGLYAPTITVMSTELNSLASGSVTVSSVGGTSGVFTNANTQQVIWSPMVLTLSTTAGAFQTGGNLSCWFLQSLDGVTFENNAAAPPRAPDAVFPLPATTLSSTTMFLAQGLVRVPALKFKILCQNNSGQSFNATGNTIALAPTAVQY